MIDCKEKDQRTILATDGSAMSRLGRPVDGVGCGGKRTWGCEEEGSISNEDYEFIHRLQKIHPRYMVSS